LGAAKTYIVDMGVSAPIFLKYNESRNDHVNNSLWGLTGLEFALSVRSPEKGISLNVFTGIDHDKVVYKISDGTRIYTNNLYLSFNPNMYIPSKWSNIKYIIGIGGFFAFATDAGMQSSLNNQAVNAYLDTAVRKFVDNKAPVVPYMSFGLHQEINNRLKINWTVTQTLINFYPINTYIDYDISGQHSRISMQYLPVYFGVRFVYLLKYHEY
jgi:hypothetical protein